MLRKDFQQAISTEDNRLKEPHQAVFLHFDGEGVTVPLLKRRKTFFNSQGVIQVDQWYGLPGGKSNPLKIDGIIRGVEDGNLAAGRETTEELGVFIEVGERIDSSPHPVMRDVEQHFYRVSAYHGGQPHNRASKEHDYLICPTPKEAIQILDSRITPKVADFILEEADRVLEKALYGFHYS